MLADLHLHRNLIHKFEQLEAKVQLDQVVQLVVQLFGRMQRVAVQYVTEHWHLLMAVQGFRQHTCWLSVIY